MNSVTKEFLKEKRACSDGFEWFCKNCLGLPLETQIQKLSEHRYNWANWLLVRLMTKQQKRQYAIFVTEHVIDIFKKIYPNDKRARKTIKVAKKVLEKDTYKNRAAAAVAASVAYIAAVADSVAYATAAAVAYSASATYATYAAYYAATVVATDTTYYAVIVAATDFVAAAADATELKQKIINYGIELIKDSK